MTEIQSEYSTQFEVFPWSRNMETGLKTVDFQHRKLVDLLNNLANFLIYEDDEKLTDVFEELAKYAGYHFTTEEGIWDKYFGSDSWAVKHHESHEAFLPEILKIREREADKPFREGVHKIVGFLVNWLALHILDDDKRMALAVHAVKRGETLEAAKAFADEAMSGSVESMVETILSMYESLSRRTIELMQEREDRRKIEEALIEARMQAEATASAKSEFLANMSHEIRTPMNGVIGMLEVLRTSDLNAEDLETVEIINQSAENLLGIINDILDFSKLESGKMDLAVEPIDLVEKVRFGCILLDKMAAQKGVRLGFYADSSIPVIVNGDSLRLNQILTNLVNNAIKFSADVDRQGFVQVSVEPSTMSEGQACFEISVSDNGIGMSEATVSKLFQPFEQAGAKTANKFGGTGLGLVITKNLVELMQGEISVKSELGAGSTFTVKLPFEVPEGTQHQELSKISDVTVLLPDQVPNIEKYLNRAGVTVVNVDGSVAQAAEGLDADSLAVVLSFDASLPAELPRKDGAPVPVIRMSPRLKGQNSKSFLLDPRPMQLASDLITAADLHFVIAKALGKRAWTSLSSMAGGSSAALAAPVTKRKLLVAEDHPINQKVILSQLEVLGYTADVANDGHEAFEMWKSGDLRWF